MDDETKIKVDSVISSYAQVKGVSEEEIRGEFEQMIDKFCADGETGQKALKFLGFEKRPSVDEFVAAMARNPALKTILKLNRKAEEAEKKDK